MPVFWGKGEHTGRIRFYSQRIMDGKPLLLVAGGQNLTQIAWTEDIASEFEAWLRLNGKSDCLVWEGLPHDGIEVRAVIADIAVGLGQSLTFESIDSSLLKKRLPEYLDAEPLWRERLIDITPSNIFSITATQLTPQSKWLPPCCADAVGDARMDLRSRELKLLGRNMA